MAKKSTKKSSKVNWKVIGTISLLINFILLVTLSVFVVEFRRGAYDIVIVDNGIRIMCTKQWRDSMDKVNLDNKNLFIAGTDFACGKNGARPFYDKAFKEYTDSLGIKNDQQ